MLTEKDVTRKFLDLIKPFAVSIKLSTLGARGSTGWPDREVILPNGRVCWVELKAPGKTPTLLQQVRLDALRNNGHDAGWFDDPLEAARFVGQCLRKAQGLPKKNNKGAIHRG